MAVFCDDQRASGTWRQKEMMRHRTREQNRRHASVMLGTVVPTERFLSLVVWLRARRRALLRYRDVAAGRRDFNVIRRVRLHGGSL